MQTEQRMLFKVTPEAWRAVELSDSRLSTLRNLLNYCRRRPIPPSAFDSFPREGDL